MPVAVGRLFHFSERGDIALFRPRPVTVPSARGRGRGWLNGPLVWAIEGGEAAHYLFPRDCPRIVARARPGSDAGEVAAVLGAARKVAFVEPHWADRLCRAVLYRYALPLAPFQPLHDAGMWVSRQTVHPLGRVRLVDLPRHLASSGTQLRVVPSLAPLRSLWDGTLQVSGIRLRNSATWR